MTYNFSANVIGTGEVKNAPKKSTCGFIGFGIDSNKNNSHIFGTQCVQFEQLLGKTPPYVPPWVNDPYCVKHKYPQYSTGYGSPPTSHARV